MAASFEMNLVFKNDDKKLQKKNCEYFRIALDLFDGMNAEFIPDESSFRRFNRQIHFKTRCYDRYGYNAVIWFFNSHLVKYS